MADCFFNKNGARDKVEIEFVTPNTAFYESNFNQYSRRGGRRYGHQSHSQFSSREGFGIMMELTKAMGKIKNNGKVFVEEKTL